ncbi:hypothetical protein Leryth_019314 [Lithospermum erythrorhizon]|nr:hypothetical protein Leryth_019314 [Lithospermum erythrorhizon]
MQRVLILLMRQLHSSDIRISADKLLIYLTFYINIALKRLEACRTFAEGTKAIINLGLEKVPVPGEPGFIFPGLFSLPQSSEEAGIIWKQITGKQVLHTAPMGHRINGSLAFAKKVHEDIMLLQQCSGILVPSFRN